MPAWLDFVLDTYSTDTIFRAASLPKPTVQMFKDGRATPGPSSTKKLNNLYRRVQRERMREASLPSREADRFKGSAPDTVNQIIDQWTTFAIGISDSKGVELDHVLEGLARTGKRYEDYEAGISGSTG